MHRFHLPAERHLIFALCSLALLMASLDFTIVAIAMPHLSSGLDAPLSWVGWTLTAYALAQIVALPVAGRLSDAYGRKRVFVLSLALFGVGSLLSGFAPNIGLLIFFRVLQSLGTGGILPSTAGIVSDQFKEHRDKAIGMFTSISPIGAILAPNLGGWILENWSWRELFFVNVPIAAAVLLATKLFLRDEPSRRRPARIDCTGLALFAGGVIAMMYGMSTAGTDRSVLGSPFFWMLILAASALLALFVRHEGRVDNPILELALVVRRPFIQANLYNVLHGAFALGTLSFIPLFAVVQYSMSPGQIGVLLTPRALLVIGASTLTSLVLLRFGYRLPMIGGALVAGAGMMLFGLGLDRAQLGPLALDGFWLVAGIVGITGIGLGLANPSSNNAVLDLVPGKTAAVTGQRAMFRVTGGIFFISTATLVLSLFDDKATGMRLVLIAGGALFLMAIPLAMLIPDTARARWLARMPNGKAKLPLAQPRAADAE